MSRETENQEAIACAIRLLSLRSHSRKELADKLQKKGYANDAVEAALDYLNEKQLIDDATFGKELISSRSRRKPVGERAMHFELTRKGVPDDLAGELLREYDSSSLCRNAAEKKLTSLKRYDTAEQKKKLETFLRNRGFGWPVIKQTIETLFHHRPS